jgi:hypothetical protein
MNKWMNRDNVLNYFNVCNGMNILPEYFQAFSGTSLLTPVVTPGGTLEAATHSIILTPGYSA